MLGSIVLFTLFAESTGRSVRSVLDKETLVRKIQFPRMVIPLSVVLLSLFNVGLNLIVVFAFALVAGVHPMLSWLELPLIVALLALLSTGPGDAAVVTVRVLPGRRSRSGRSSPRSCSTPRR